MGLLSGDTPTTPAGQPAPNDPNMANAVSPPTSTDAPDLPDTSAEPEQPTPPPTQTASVPAQAAATSMDAVPDFAKDDAGSHAEGLAETALQGASRPFGVFKLLKDGHYEATIDGSASRLNAFEGVDVVILGAGKQHGRTLWKEGVKHPLCQSTLGDKPDVGVKDPKSDSCATCAYAQFGSAKELMGQKNKGPACRDKMRLALVAPDMPETILQWEMSFTQRSLLGAYVKSLTGATGQKGVVIDKLVTRLKSSVGGNKQAVPTFEFHRWLTDAEWEAHRAGREAKASVIEEILNPTPRVVNASRQAQIEDHSDTVKGDYGDEGTPSREPEHDDEIPF